MIYPSEKEFLKLAKKGNLIPVYKQILADLETPVSAYSKIADGSYSFLLESVEEQEKIGRFSFLAAQPIMVFQSKGKRIKIIDRAKKKTRTFTTLTHPLEEIKKIMSSFKIVDLAGLPRFCGGLVGYIGYDCVRFFERLPKINKDDLRLPDSTLMLAKDLLIFDHIQRTIKIVSCAYIAKDKSPAALKRAYRNSLAVIEGNHRRLKNRVVKGRKESLKKSKNKFKITSNLKEKDFLQAVTKAKDYIRKGDIIQVVLSQRFSVDFRGQSFSLYRNLRSINPSPYMFFLKLGNFSLVGSSPEMLVRYEQGKVETRPIAGTRPRGVSDAEDERLKKELLADAKERAEHTMLVDLGRNDLGRVCKFKSINLAEFMKIEYYSHVMHIVSSIQGILKKTCDIFQLLIACFPAGTVTGAPKVRAMEIIEELEGLSRGPYAGCVGYFSFAGNLDTCITIRTILIKGNKAYVQAGAGIVADSKPKKEYQETVNKAKAMLEALKIG
ncbi:MAG: anthranilate synthase component I [Candidatus Omnitrophica bacterium]|nr:anthranilate synthase component I [Candidatus Omnitrophota bacterium]